MGQERECCSPGIEQNIDRRSTAVRHDRLMQFVGHSHDHREGERRKIESQRRWNDSRGETGSEIADHQQSENPVNYRVCRLAQEPRRRFDLLPGESSAGAAAEAKQRLRHRAMCRDRRR